MVINPQHVFILFFETSTTIANHDFFERRCGSGARLNLIGKNKNANGPPAGLPKEMLEDEVNDVEATTKNTCTY